MEENDPLWKMVVDSYKRSGANVGPKKSMFEDSLKQVKEKTDKAAKDIQPRKTSEAGFDTDVATAKKGGAVKGWGIARGARKAKMY